MHTQDLNQNGRKIIYTALFVENKEELLHAFTPKHPKILAHHSTIAFRPKTLDGIEIGKESYIKIIGRASDEKGDVLLVENPKSNNKYPHITLSCSDGIPPTYSNELIEKAMATNAVEYFSNPKEIHVIEGYFDGINDIKS